MAGVSAVVVAHNSRASIAQCIRSVLDAVDDLVVVDSGSSDGTAELVRERFASVCVIEGENRGFGAAMNRGVAETHGEHVLLLNADTWVVGDGVARLAECAAADDRIAVAGPRLSNPDGTLQRSVRGFPTPWRLATEYFFLRWLAPRTRLLNAFYAAGFDHRTDTDAEFLVGAVLLARRSALDEVGGFDPAFFMFDEEVDLCYRLRLAGWRVRFCADAEFVHVGGASTQPVWDAMYIEQLRSHLRFLAKHRSPAVAERTRRMLVYAMRTRALVFSGPRSRLSTAAAHWLASGSAGTLLAGRDDTQIDGAARLLGRDRHPEPPGDGG